MNMIQTPPGPSRRQETSHAEGLAKRIIAFYCERRVARSGTSSLCSNRTGKSDAASRPPESIIENTSRGQASADVSRPNNVSMKNIREAPLPPPPRRCSSLSGQASADVSRPNNASMKNIREAPLPPPPPRRRHSLSVNNIDVSKTNTITVPPPPPLSRRSSLGDVEGCFNSLKKDPMPLPLGRRSSLSDVEECFNKSTHSMKAENNRNHSEMTFKDSFKSEFSGGSRSNSSLHKLKSLSSSDLNNSQPTRDFNTKSHAFSSSDFIEPRDTDVPREVRITQFKDEPESVLESAESLPSHCDKKGQCVFHPHIRLYKKGLLGGFSLVRSVCPLCELQNMNLPAADKHQYVQQNQKISIRIKKSTSSDGKRTTSSDSKRSNSVGSSGRKKVSGSCAAMTEYERSMSEYESICVERGTAFLEKSFRSTSTKRSLAPQGKKLLVNKGRSESVTGSCVKGEYGGRSLAVNDHLNARMESPRGNRICDKSSNKESAENSMSHGKKRKDNSRLSEIETSSLRSSMSMVESSHDDSQLKVSTDASDSVQGTTSILDKGLEKLSLLKNRSSSRNKSTSGSLANRSIGSVTIASKNSKTRQKGKLFDSTGRCKCHPSIIIAKKRPFANGWDMIRDYCPLCAESESGFHLLGSESNGERELQELNTTSAELTNSKFRSRSASRMDALHRSENSARSRSSSRCKPSAFDNMPSQAPRVEKMPYITPSKEPGWYTGEVNDCRLPNGRGRMRTKTGNILEGNWISGCFEEHIDTIRKMKSGFGTNVAPWKQSALSPHYNFN